MLNVHGVDIYCVLIINVCSNWLKKIAFISVEFYTYKYIFGKFQMLDKA